MSKPTPSARFCIVHEGREIALGEAPFIVGRHPSCHLLVGNDPLISRRHAAFEVTDRGVRVQDLGSTNGVWVNGEKLAEPRWLQGGESVTVGHQQLGLIRREVDPARDGLATWNEATPLTSSSSLPNLARNSDPPPSGTTSGTTRKAEMLDVLFDLADKSLAKGDHAAAERIVAPYLRRMLARAQRRELEPGQLERAGRFAAALAMHTRKAEWFDQLVALYAAAGQLLPGDVVDQLYDAVPKLGRIDSVSLREYVLKLVSSSSSLTPNERFVLRRLRGIENLVALK